MAIDLVLRQKHRCRSNKETGMGVGDLRTGGHMKPKRLMTLYLHVCSGSLQYHCCRDVVAQYVGSARRSCRKTRFLPEGICPARRLALQRFNACATARMCCGPG